MIIGIDFDNTLAGYDHLFTRLAREHGWLPSACAGSKVAVREALRAQPEGEARWQVVQGEAYGRCMGEARLLPGAGEFLALCRARGQRVVIVSHKTRYAARDPWRVDLRQAALDWMAGQGFFLPERFGLDRARVFFEDDREAKVARIAALGCTHFIDDLEEVFRHPAFPVGVTGFLLQRTGGAGPWRLCPHWDDIRHALFP